MNAVSLLSHKNSGNIPKVENGRNWERLDIF